MAMMSSARDGSIALHRAKRAVERLSMVLIAGNVCMMWVQLQYEGHTAGIGLGAARPGTWPQLDGVFFVLEHSFNALFLLELAMRLLLQRSEFFYKDGALDTFNIFDAALVFFTSLDLYLFSPILSSPAITLTVFRPFRFVRLARTLRLASSVQFFLTLRLMINAISASFNSLFWSAVLLLGVMVIAALLVCQSLQDVLAESDGSILPETMTWIFIHYGTPIRAFWSVFEFTFGGGLKNQSRRLVEEVSNWYALFFFTYVFLVVFALFRIITAVFLKDTMEVAARDAQLLVQKKMQQKEEFARQMLEFFEVADTSGDGYMTLEELHAVLSNPKIRTWLGMMELSVLDTEELFAILDNGDGMVSCEEFTQGVVHLKGTARSQDVMAIKQNSMMLAKEVKALHQALKRLNPAVRQSEGESADRAPVSV